MAKNPTFVDTHQGLGPTGQANGERFFLPLSEWPTLGQNVIYQISVAAGPNDPGRNRNHIKYG